MKHYTGSVLIADGVPDSSGDAFLPEHVRLPVGFVPVRHGSFAGPCVGFARLLWSGCHVAADIAAVIEIEGFPAIGGHGVPRRDGGVAGLFDLQRIDVIAVTDQRNADARIERIVEATTPIPDELVNAAASVDARNAADRDYARMDRADKQEDSVRRIVVSVQGTKGVGKTTLSGIIQRALVALGFKVDVVEKQDGRPMSQRDQEHAAVYRDEHRADLTEGHGREVLIEVENGRAAVEPFTFDEYRDGCTNLAIYPGQGSRDGMSYTVIGGVGEFGELANKWKKVLRDHDGIPTDEFLTAMRKELGGTLWYLDRIAFELGTDLGTVARDNLKELRSREARGTLRGSGDNR